MKCLDCGEESLGETVGNIPFCGDCFVRRRIEGPDHEQCRECESFVRQGYFVKGVCCVCFFMAMKEEESVVDGSEKNEGK